MYRDRNRSRGLKRDSFGYDFSGQLTAANYGLVGGINPNRAVG